MQKKINLQIGRVHSLKDKLAIETEIEVLEGVANIQIDETNGNTWIEFDDAQIAEEELLQAIKKLGFSVMEKSGPKEAHLQKESCLKDHSYFVKGMHCASCEIVIEKKLLEQKGIKAVEASIGKGQVRIEYEGELPAIEKLNKIFQGANYVFSNHPRASVNKSKSNNFWQVIGIAAIVFVIFFLMNKLGLGRLVNVNSTSSLPTFFTLGLIAGISSCAALVGGLVLSMSKQWNELYAGERSTWKKMQPHLMFTIGRLVSYAGLGMLLGVIGSKLQISLRFTVILVIAVSVVMVLMALQMLGVKALRRFQFTMPSFVTRYIGNERNFQGKYMPFLLGALTFFLPCGFTITAQGLALLSGSAWQGGLIMLLFALGTVPMLISIGFSSVKFSERPHLAATFSKVAGIVILFFAFFNINSQLNVLGVTSLNDLWRNNAGAVVQDGGGDQSDGLAPVVDGKQVLKMDASASGYQPNHFKIKAGVPVRWEITDTGTSGCTNAVISQGLFDGSINLTPGQTAVKEFTVAKPGKYKFSCWMGMISGEIEVIDQKGVTASAKAADNNIPVPSGAKGCGCGGGGGNSCGGS